MNKNEIKGNAPDYYWFVRRGLKPPPYITIGQKPIIYGDNQPITRNNPEVHEDIKRRSNKFYFNNINNGRI